LRDVDSELVLVLDFSNSLVVIVFGSLELFLKVGYFGGLSRVRSAIFIDLLHSFLLLPECPDPTLKVLVLIFKLAFQLLDPEGHLLAALLLFLGHRLGILRSLDQHSQTVGVLRLDGVLVDLALPFKLLDSLGAFLGFLELGAQLTQLRVSGRQLSLLV